MRIHELINDALTDAEDIIQSSENRQNFSIPNQLLDDC